MTRPAKKSAFSAWFEAQFGARTMMPRTSDADLIKRVEAGEDARAELHRRREWDAREAAALSAWCIVDDDKRKPKKW